MRVRGTWWLLGLGLLGCQTVGGAQPQAPLEFKATGGVSIFTEGASFDEDQVVGPQVNVSRRADGSWGGVMLGQAVNLTQYGEQFRGLNTLLRAERKGSRWVLSGQWQGEMVRFEFEPNRVQVWSGTRSFTLAGDGKGVYGPDSQVRLTGASLSEAPPFPQVMLAFIAASVKPSAGQPGGVGGQGWGLNPALGGPR